VKQAPSLFGFNPSDLSIGLKKGEPLKDLKQPFATCHPAVKRARELCERIAVFVFPKQSLSNPNSGAQTNPIGIKDNNNANRRELPKEGFLPTNVHSSAEANKSQPQAAQTPLARVDMNPSSPPSWFGGKAGVQRETYFYLSRKDKGKTEKRWIVVSSTGFMIFKTKDDTVPLYVFPLSALNVMESAGLGDTFEIEVDDKVFSLHSPDIKEAKEWYKYLMETVRQARKEQKDPHVDFEGMLMKREDRGGNTTSWKRQWCVLKSNTLWCYKNQKAAQYEPGRPEDFISLNDCLVRSGTTKGVHCFQIVMPNKVVAFGCKSEDEMRQWIIAVNQSRKQSKMAEGPSVEKEMWSLLPEFSAYQWANLKRIVKKFAVPPKEDTPSMEKVIDNVLNLSQLRKMIGEEQFLFVKDFVKRTRKKFLSVSQNAKGVYFDAALSPLEYTPVSPDFPKSLNVVFYFKQAEVFKNSTIYYKMINCPRETTVAEAIEKALKKTLKDTITQQEIISQFLIKIFGRREYILDITVPLVNVKYVRLAVAKRKKIELCLVDKAKIYLSAVEEQRRDTSWNLADAFGIQLPTPNDNNVIQQALKSPPTSPKWVRRTPQGKMNPTYNSANATPSSQPLRSFPSPALQNETLDSTSKSQLSVQYSDITSSSSALEAANKVKSSFILKKDPITGRIVIDDILPSQQSAQDEQPPNIVLSTSPKTVSNDRAGLSKLSTPTSTASKTSDVTFSSPPSSRKEHITTSSLNNQSHTPLPRLVIDIQTGKSYEVSETEWQRMRNQKPDTGQVKLNSAKNETTLSLSSRKNNDVSFNQCVNASHSSASSSPEEKSKILCNDTLSTIEATNAPKGKRASAPSLTTPQTAGARSSPKIVMLYPKRNTSSPIKRDQQTTAMATQSVSGTPKISLNTGLSSSLPLTSPLTPALPSSLSSSPSSSFPASSSSSLSSSPSTSSPTTELPTVTTTSLTNIKHLNTTPTRIKEHYLKNSNERIFIPAPPTLSDTPAPVLSEKKSLHRSQSFNITINNDITAKTLSTPQESLDFHASSGDKQMSTNISNDVEDYNSNNEWEQIEEKCINIDDVDKLFEFKICGMETFNKTILKEIFNVNHVPDKSISFYIEVELCFGDKVIEGPLKTSEKTSPYWSETLRSNIKYCELPRETKLCITLYASSGKQEVPLGWVNKPIADPNGKIRGGIQTLSMWESRQKACPTKPCEQNPNSSLCLKIQFEDVPEPIIFVDPVPLSTEPTASEKDNVHKRVIEEVLQKDPLNPLSEDEQALLWQHRKYLQQHYPHSLPKLLLSVDWLNKSAVAEIHRMLLDWKPLEPVKALELLDFKYADSQTRAFAVKCLQSMSDWELEHYLLQLVQVLKVELYALNPLSRFLISRAIRCPSLIGHSLFWHLQAEMHVEELRGKFGLMQWCILTGLSKANRNMLQGELTLIQHLQRIHARIAATSPSQRTQELREALKVLASKLPPSFQLPIGANFVCRGLLIEECKVIDSFTVPLWLVFENEEPLADPIPVIYKAGDDLRQDVLTLQMFEIMDNLWKENGMDLQMTLYRVVATGENSGMIEVVPNSVTTATIQKEAGGVAGAFKKNSIVHWLSKHNPNAAQMNEAVTNFTLSCAAFCVATYVIGIGDRHNDNIMLCKSGHLFHIDFAHFLGNIMRFGAYKRERAPFVLTPDFVQVMGGTPLSSE
jgi:hypothetical protein